MHGFAAGTYPFLKNLPPQQFAKAAVDVRDRRRRGAADPVRADRRRRGGADGFSGGLLGLYLRTPGMRKPGSLAPTEQGLAIAKDSWLLGIGIGLLTRGTIDRPQPRRVRKAAKKLAKADGEGAEAAASGTSAAEAIRGAGEPIGARRRGPGVGSRPTPRSARARSDRHPDRTLPRLAAGSPSSPSASAALTACGGTAPTTPRLDRRDDQQRGGVLQRRRASRRAAAEAEAQS